MIGCVERVYTMEEVWKRLIYHGKDLGDWYEVSNIGNIRNSRTHRIRKLNVLPKGYAFVGVSIGSRNVKPCIKVHRAVAETFIPNPKNLPAINHIDGNKLNNVVENLEWCTYKENTKHAMQTGLRKPQPRSYHNPCCKLNKEQVDYIKNFYIPYDKEYGSRALARKFNVTHYVILRAYNYKE